MSYFGHYKYQMGLTISDAKIKKIDILLKYFKTRKLIYQRNKKLKANIYASILYNNFSTSVLLQLYFFSRVTYKYAIAAINTCYKF